MINFKQIFLSPKAQKNVILQFYCDGKRGFTTIEIGDFSCFLKELEKKIEEIIQNNKTLYGLDFSKSDLLKN